MIKPRVKICCISSIEEANMAVKYGASALGLVSEMPSGPGVISEKLIYEIAATIPPAIGSFLLTSKRSADEIIQQQKKCRVNSIQLCDFVERSGLEKLRIELPGISLIQVIHVKEGSSIKEAVEVSPFVDALLLDSGDKNSEIKELGGTGRVHNWEISREINKRVSIPIFLAGGLNLENVVDAIKQVEPFGVDVCSGVRTNGKMDEIKLSKFFKNINSKIQFCK
ncbi:MAG: phosphoribosylanthranilate isomerase [Ignavibacteria bacterium]|nr:phosphoribosylanthranilate isomerase [Ignavibacteria bacterium]